MRQIVLDTETTGLSPNKGDRIVEVGCVELVNRKLTGRHFHYYINPERDIPDEVVAVHGIDNDKVKDAPKFRDIAQEFWDYAKGAELVIHNAAFDMGFLEMEFERLRQEGHTQFSKLIDVCTVLDTLQVAREKHPGAKASLDALCKRYGIDNSHRTLHGALLDSEILADVYLLMTGGQTDLILDEEEDNQGEQVSFDASHVLASGEALKKVLPSEDEKAAHEAMLSVIDKACGGEALWRQKLGQ
ncbi:DNA polymerase III subunit epsilon [Saccharospirillum salsuginis]|uniref:DNA polymerase III subunit epsilon n=1 Tax=Saccharospirillum salsuginis TaxID=418750 RepID=A0A918K626_9GAMM|nr:DNA polymerase III subunit epsilon [Saccharospirillum salsuginis]GGX51311.1 DNA polymerase III subunit epsilon [Saccharospirillum salsuginis]